MTLLRFSPFNDRYFNQHKMYVQAAHLMDVLSGTQEDLDLATVSAQPSFLPFLSSLFISYPSLSLSLSLSLSPSLTHTHTHIDSFHIFNLTLFPSSDVQINPSPPIPLHLFHLHFTRNQFSPLTLTLTSCDWSNSLLILY